MLSIYHNESLVLLQKINSSRNNMKLNALSHSAGSRSPNGTKFFMLSIYYNKILVLLDKIN